MPANTADMSRPRRLRVPLALPLLAVLVLGILASAAMFLQMQAREYEFENFRFELAADASVAALRSGLDNVVLAQKGFNRSVEPLVPVSSERLQALAQPILSDFPYLRTLQFVPLGTAPGPRPVARTAQPDSFTVTVPVYRAGERDGTRRAIAGHTLAEIDTGKLMAQAFPTWGPLEEFDAEISVYAGAGQPVFRRNVTRTPPAAGALRLLDWFQLQLPPLSRTFDVAGVPWQVIVRAQPLPLGSGTGAPLMTLLAGGMFCVGLAIFLQALGSRSQRIQRLVDERTLELSESNARLMRDIAARQRIELALLQTQQVLTLAQKVAHLGSWELDAATGELQCSDELYRICGLRPQSVHTTLEFLLGLTHPDDRNAINQAITATRFQGKDFRMQSRIVRPDGSIRHVISLGVATRDENQLLVKVAGSLLDVTEQKETELALRRSQEELRLLVAYDERIREDERKRIAREVHDELGGLLTGIKAYLSVALEQAVQHGKPVNDLLAEAGALADQATDTVRKVITDLRPSVLDQLGVWAALQWYAEQIEKRSGLACECVIEDAVAAAQLDPDRSIALFRIVQEALTNVTRHARASQVRISATLKEKRLVIEIKDDGIGIKSCRSQDRTAWGIVGMQERARHFGGEFSIADAPDGGTVATLRLPVDYSSAGKT